MVRGIDKDRAVPGNQRESAQKGTQLAATPAAVDHYADFPRNGSWNGAANFGGVTAKNDDRAGDRRAGLDRELKGGFASEDGQRLWQRQQTRWSSSQDDGNDRFRHVVWVKLSKNKRG